MLIRDAYYHIALSAIPDQTEPPNRSRQLRWLGAWIYYRNGKRQKPRNAFKTRREPHACPEPVEGSAARRRSRAAELRWASYVTGSFDFSYRGSMVRTSPVVELIHIS
jgi:hypothetical protein